MHSVSWLHTLKEVKVAIFSIFERQMNFIRVDNGHSEDLKLAVRVADTPHIGAVVGQRYVVSVDSQDVTSCANLVSEDDIVYAHCIDPEWLIRTSVIRLKLGVKL